MPITVKPIPTFNDLVNSNRAAIIEFARREMEENPARNDADFWSFFDSVVSLFFIINEDPESENFERREVWAVINPENKEGVKNDTDADEILILVV